MPGGASSAVPPTARRPSGRGAAVASSLRLPKGPRAAHTPPRLPRGCCLHRESVVGGGDLVHNDLRESRQRRRRRQALRRERRGDDVCVLELDAIDTLADDDPRGRLACAGHDTHATGPAPVVSNHSHAAAAPRRVRKHRRGRIKLLLRRERLGRRNLRRRRRLRLRLEPRAPLRRLGRGRGERRGHRRRLGGRLLLWRLEPGLRRPREDLGAVVEQVGRLVRLHLRHPQRAVLRLLRQHLAHLRLHRADPRRPVRHRDGRHDARLDGAARVPQHLLEEGAVALADERDGAAGVARARGPADAVDVRRHLGGQLVVDDRLDAADVESAAGEVGRDEEVGLAEPEGLEGLQPLQLRQVAVQLRRAQLREPEEEAQPVRLCL
mmetsp:Transcript_15767/g.50851  ORF Transcript_15767/g.50851 Transcript_15767/m.50851 type:complete len:380 (+) Transcript_15767:58-1197(+)